MKCLIYHLFMKTMAILHFRQFVIPMLHFLITHLGEQHLRKLNDKFSDAPSKPLKRQMWLEAVDNLVEVVSPKL